MLRTRGDPTPPPSLLAVLCRSQQEGNMFVGVVSVVYLLKICNCRHKNWSTTYIYGDYLEVRMHVKFVILSRCCVCGK